MRPQLYVNEVCPNATSIILTAKVLQLSLDVKQAKDCANQQLHAPIVLKDSGYAIWDSYAIMAFLIGKYGQDDSLYPRRSEIRNRIDEILLFDSGVLSFFTKHLTSENVQKIDEIYQVVERFFVGSTKWVAGDDLTIADLALLPSITALGLLRPLSAKAHPKLAAWVQQAQNCDFYEPNRQALCKLQSQLC